MIKVSLNAVTKPSHVLRLAAQVVKEEMEHDAAIRFGACSALHHIGCSIEDAFCNSNAVEPQSLARLYRKLNQSRRAYDEAKEIFNELFAPKQCTTNSYWFGKKFTDKEQEHRINALLLAADIAESEGK